MNQILVITLLGGFAAHLADGAAISLRSRKGELLIAFLAMQPGYSATREQVVGVLWSDRSEPQQRASLRQELTALRKNLHQFLTCPIVADGERLSLNASSVRVDAVEFVRLSASGDAEAAVASYRGEFLAGAVVRDPAGEDWLRAQRQQMRDRLTAALHLLVGERLAKGALPGARDAALRLADEDPFLEDAHRAAMALLAATGRRAQALKHFDSYDRLIRSELQIAPGTAIEQMVADIRSFTGEANPEQVKRLLEVVAVDFGFSPSRRARAVDDHPAAAVLPFAGSADTETFADGLVDGITDALSRIRSLFVIARSSMERYRHEPADTARIGRELGVRYLVQGSVQQIGERIRVRAVLIEAESNGMLWSDHHDGTLADAFDLQDRIVERIVGAIAPSVRMAEIERARRKRPDSLAAYDYVMRALPQLWTMTRDANAEALRLTCEAIRIDPNYAVAHAYAAWCHFWGFSNNWSDSMAASRAQAHRLVERALRLDESDPAVLSIAALAATALEHDLEAASHYIGKALQLDPNYAWGWNRNGYISVYRDRLEEGLECFERAARLSPFDPLSFNRHVGMALAHYCAGRYDEAARLAERGRLERPGLPWAYRVLAAANAERGDLDSARAAVGVLLRDVPTLTVAQVMDSMPFKRRDIYEQFSRNLASAGMPLT